MSGPVPFGLRRHDGKLVPNPSESAVVREIAEAFVASGGRMKATAASLNTKGFRTRQGAPWSDTATSRALRVICDNGLVPGPLRDRCAALLDQRSAPNGAPERRSVHPLGSVVHCRCGGRMYVIGTGAAAKFVCRGCRAKITAMTLERVFVESLASVEVTSDEVVAAYGDNPRAAELTRWLGGKAIALSQIWGALDSGERRQLVDVAISRILVDDDLITVVVGLDPDPTRVSAPLQPHSLPTSYGSHPPKKRATDQGNEMPKGAAVADTKVTSAVAPGPKAYRVRHVAELLSLPKSTVYDMVRTGALPSVRTGGQGGGAVLVPASAVDEFLESKKRRNS